MQAANVLISRDTTVSLVPGNFAHVIFSSAGLKGSLELLVSARLPPLINVGCIPLIKLLAQQYLALSFYLSHALNCSLCWGLSDARGMASSRKLSSHLLFQRRRMAVRGGYWMQRLNTAAVKSRPSWCILGPRKPWFVFLSMQFTCIYIDYTHTHTSSSSMTLKWWRCLLKIAYFRCHFAFFSYGNVLMGGFSLF